MKLRWLAILLAALLVAPGCKRSENTPDVEEDDLNLDLESGVETDADEINERRTTEDANTTTDSSTSDTDTSTDQSDTTTETTETTTESTDNAPAP